MSSPQEKLSYILQKYPEGADVVYGLLLWAYSAKGNIVDQLEFDELMDCLYGRTSDGHKHRKDHDRRLLGTKDHAAIEHANTDLPA